MPYEYDHTVLDASGAGAPLCPVEIRLETLRKSPGFGPDGGVSQTRRVTTNANGYFVTGLEPNTGAGAITDPASTRYTIIERLSALNRRDEDRVWQVVVDGDVDPALYLGAPQPIPLAQFRVAIGSMPDTSALDAHNLSADAHPNEPEPAAGSDLYIVRDISAPGKLVGAYDLIVDGTPYDYPGGTDYDIVIADAAVGDVVICGLNGRGSDHDAQLIVDVCSVVGGAPVNFWATDSATEGGFAVADRYPGSGSTPVNLTGLASRAITADDLDAGVLRLRARYLCLADGSGTKWLYADEIAPFVFTAERRGPYA